VAKKRKAKKVARKKRRAAKKGALARAKKSLNKAMDVVVGAARDTKMMRRKLKQRVGLGEG
jgi:hypothetical protein